MGMTQPKPFLVQSPRDLAIAILKERPDIRECDLIRESGWTRGNVKRLMGKRPQDRPRKTAKLDAARRGCRAGTAGGLIDLPALPDAGVATPPPQPLPPSEPAPAASPRPSRAIAPGTGLVLQGIGWAMVPVAVWINAQTGWRFGTTEQSALAFACLSGIADALVIWLPRCATAAWLGKQRITSAGMWAVLAVIYSLPILASLGFADLHIADTAAVRAAAITTASELAARRSAAIDTARAATQATSWSRASECRSRGPRCRDLERVEQVRLSELKAALDTPVTPPAAIGDVDPQVAGAVRLATWLGIHLSSADVGNLRLVLMGLLPNLAGLVLAFGWALRRPVSLPDQPQFLSGAHRQTTKPCKAL